MQSSSENGIKLPDGRTVSVLDVIGFIYGLTNRDIEIFNMILNSNTPLSMDDISQRLGITKSVVNKSILNLEKKGLIIKEKTETPKKGRRTYLYKADPQYLSKKIINDIDHLTDIMKSKIIIVTGLKVEK